MIHGRHDLARQPDARGDREAPAARRSVDDGGSRGIPDRASEGVPARPRPASAGAQRPGPTSRSRSAISASASPPGRSPVSAAARATSTLTASRTGLAARRLLKRRGVRLGDPFELVLALGEGAGGRAHGRAPSRDRARGRSSASASACDLLAADRDLHRDLVRQLREPADVADHERPAEAQRPDDARPRSRPSSGSGG